MEESDWRNEHESEKDSLVDKHGLDNVMRGLLAVKPKTEKKSELKKRKGKTAKR